MVDGTPTTPSLRTLRLQRWGLTSCLFESVQQRCLWLASAGLAACNHSTPSLVPWSWVLTPREPCNDCLVMTTCHLSSPTVLVLGPGLDASPIQHPRRPHWCATALSTIKCVAKRPSPGAYRMANLSSGTWRFICTMRTAPCAIFELSSRTAASSPWLNASCNSTRQQLCRNEIWHGGKSST